MAAGGISAETAGLLESGSGNTFDPSTGVEFAHPGYWKFTVDDYEYVTVNCGLTTFDGTPVTVIFSIYQGDTEPETLIFNNLGSLDHTIDATFQASPRETYWVIVRGNLSADWTHIDTVVVTRGLSSIPRRYTGWSDALQSLDNTLVVSAQEGELMDLNPDPFNPRLPGVLAPVWFAQVIEIDGSTTSSEEGISFHTGPPARFAKYTAQEVISGESPTNADDCVWSHVEVGDRDDQYWSSTPDDQDGPGMPPVCKTLPADHSPAHVADPEVPPTYSLSFDSSFPTLGSHLDGREQKVARGGWFLPVRDNLPPQGVLGDPFSLIDIVAVGIPADYDGSVYIEFEDIYADLVQIDAAADREDRTETDDLETTFHLNTDLDVLPTYGSGAWADHWSIGKLGIEVVPPPPTRKMRFTSDGSGTVAWNWLSAFLDWDDCSSWPDGDPDVIAGMELVIPGTPTIDSSASGATDLAFRFTLRSPRFRLVYFPDLHPVTRQEPRSPDALGLSVGTRIFPAPTAGRIYGGDQ